MRRPTIEFMDIGPTTPYQKILAPLEHLAEIVIFSIDKRVLYPLRALLLLPNAQQSDLDLIQPRGSRPSAIGRAQDQQPGTGDALLVLIGQAGSGSSYWLPVARPSQLARLGCARAPVPRFFLMNKHEQSDSIVKFPEGLLQ